MRNIHVPQPMIASLICSKLYSTWTYIKLPAKFIAMS